MGHSIRMRAADMRAVYRTVREACELGDDATAWRAHVLERIDGLMGMTMGMMFVAPLPLDAAAVGLQTFVGRGIEPHWAQYVARLDVRPDPCTPWIVARLHRGLAGIRQQMCDERTWYGSEYFNEVLRPGRLDHYVLSVMPVPENRVFSTIGLTGGLGDAPYGPREVGILRMLHAELACLWRTPGLQPVPDWRKSLSPRLAQVLEGLERGLSEKQIARDLGLSRPTVHNHITRLHRLLDVNSRGELLAKSCPRPAFRPRLLPPPPSQNGQSMPAGTSTLAVEECSP
ncbi:MAG TPA: LuxR C-terminal-related transcriptional regulator [Tepidisphaeraceae bacterium]|jgi:DNA-binding CsgD family transcriptional regulator